MIRVNSHTELGELRQEMLPQKNLDKLCITLCSGTACRASDSERIVTAIDQVKCTKCGTYLDVCPPRFRAVRKISGEPVSPPEDKILVRAER